MKLLILDGNSIINRAFFGVRQLSTRDGQPTNAIFGFLNILQKLRTAEQPEAICVTFDRKAPTFRHLRYDQYKANRHGMPEELAAQMPVMKQVLTAMNIPIYECDGWEADDIIGTVGRLCGEQGWQCVVATGDRDSLQLLNDTVSVRLAKIQGGQTDWKEYTPAVFAEEYGFEPPKLIDLKALMGDSSDNIPGVRGVGEKTAKELLWKFGSLDGVYANLDSEAIKPAARKKLTDDREMAYLSFELATIRLDAPIEFRPEDNLVQEPDKPALYDLFCRLEFVKLIDRYHLREATPVQETAKYAPREPIRVTDQTAQLLESFCAAEGVAVELDDTTVAACLDGQTYLWDVDDDTLKTLFSAKIRWLTHDSKTLTRQLLARDIEPGEFCFDCAVAAYLLDANQGKYEPERLSIRYLGREPEGNGPGDRAAVTEALYPILLQALRDEGQEKLYFEVELPLCRVLAQMEQNGVLVDRFALMAFGSLLTERIAAAEKIIYDYAGETFNIQSTKQLGTLLFEKLGLPPVKKTKTGYSTNAEILEKLRDKHPIIPAILDYRMLTKLNSTYAEGLLKFIDEDGRIRTTFQNTVTATGRLSSTDPNLQNIPVRTEMGSEIRKMFVPREGWQFVDADYSQIELRVLAHIAGDETMQEAFRSGEDFHTATAAQVFGVELSAVTPEMRRSAKAVNFGVVYGISEFSLAEDIGVSRGEAKAFIETYLARFSGVAAYQESIVKTAYDTGFVTTLFGRKRLIPELKDPKYMMRMAGERIALNTPIQGTAADIMKIATVRVAEAFRREKLQARLVLQIHDELIAECPPAETERVKKILIREMGQAAALDVPLAVEAKSGESWYAAK